jgi:DNA-binding transcriptional MerR regulator
MNRYTIKDLETLSGIKAHTIRIWEKRYGLLVPKRSTTNIRFYDDEELKKLLNVSMLVKHGYKISKVAALEDEQIWHEILKLNSKELSAGEVIDQLIVHLVNFDDESFGQLIERQIATLGFEETVADVIFPLFRNVGVYWQTGSIFPAQEHFVSNIVRELLINQSLAFKNYQATETVLFFLKEGEMHELGLLFYNYIALKSGYKTIYLGQNVPFDDLVKIEGLKKFGLVFTAFTNGIAPEELQLYLNKIEEVFKKKTVYVSGAQITKHTPKLPPNFTFISDIHSFKMSFETVG